MCPCRSLFRTIVLVLPLLLALPPASAQSRKDLEKKRAALDKQIKTEQPIVSQLIKQANIVLQ